MKNNFKVGDLVRSKKNDNFTYRVMRVGRKYLDVKPIDTGWTDCVSKNVDMNSFIKISKADMHEECCFLAGIN